MCNEIILDEIGMQNYQHAGHAELKYWFSTLCVQGHHYWVAASNNKGFISTLYLERLSVFGKVGCNK